MGLKKVEPGGLQSRPSS